MIYVDRRAGSQDLIEPLRERGLPVEETTLEFGDVAFEGRGDAGAPLAIGIEFKTLQDLVSSIRSERLQGHQLVGMTQCYDYRWLLIEGEVFFDHQGLLLKWAGSHHHSLKLPGSMTVGELMKRLHVMDVCAGLRPLWSRDRSMSIKHIELLYRFWTDKDLDEHKSHIADYVPPSLMPISRMRSFLQRLPGVGPTASMAAQLKFRSIRKAVNAPEDKWADLELVDSHGNTKRLGTKAARAIQEAFDHEP